MRQSRLPGKLASSSYQLGSLLENQTVPQESYSEGEIFGLKEFYMQSGKILPRLSTAQPNGQCILYVIKKKEFENYLDLRIYEKILSIGKLDPVPQPD